MKDIEKAVWLCAALCLESCDRPVSTTASQPTSTAHTARVAGPLGSVPPRTAGVSAPTSASAPQAPATDLNLVTFNGETIGAPSPAFDAVVGDWYVSEVAGARGLKVDGGKWRSGTPSVNLADQAKRLYGDRYAEFLDGVKAFAFFPLAVWKGEPAVTAGDLRISVRFYPLAGQVDQAAGIAFDIAPDGSYLGVRANALEDNLLFFRVVKGRRTVSDDIRNIPTPSKTWHTLALELRGKELTADVDGQVRFHKSLAAVPKGRIGLWSKADSQVLFDDFRIEPVRAAAATSP